MILKFEYGIKKDGILYGWNEKKLYRLPQMINKRFYPLKELNIWKRNGKENGYYLAQKNISFNQLKNMTIFIDEEVQLIESKDVPY